MKKQALALAVIFFFTAGPMMTPLANAYSAMDVAPFGDTPAEPPAPGTPTLMALPGTGQALDKFAYDNQDCRNIATQIAGNPEEIAQDKAVGTAIAETLLSAFFGGLLGAGFGGKRGIGPGLAVGAGVGLSKGAVSGAIAGDSAGERAQVQLDQLYWKCMFERGHKVPSAPPVQQAPPSAPMMPSIPPPPPPRR